MRWGFRVASDPRFGAGHVSRCGALARALGEPAIAFMDQAEAFGPGQFGWAEELVPERSVDGAQHAVSALAGGRIEALIIDSYAIAETTVTEATASGFTAVFRDGAPYGRECLTIDPRPGAAPAPNVLGGPAYMPLAPAFEQRHDRALWRVQAREGVSSILIAFGARDSADRTTIALAAIGSMRNPPRTTVALPSSAPHRRQVEQLAVATPGVEMFDGGNDLGDWYGRFDLAIGAPGVSQFERACCGLPGILVAQNERQHALAREWQETGAALAAGSSVASVGRELSRLCRDPERIGRMRRRGLSLVDGRGALRVAAALKGRVKR